MFDKLYVLIDKKTKRVVGFTKWKDYAQEHPEIDMIEISEEHEVWLSENPQDYVYDEKMGSFVIQKESNETS